MRKVILRNFQSPGDIVMLTAAVRDLHRTYPNDFQTDVRTPCPALWENNPNITALSESDPSVQTIDCQYPLINCSNSAPFHFIHGFVAHLSEALQVTIKPTDFKGDIHLASKEKSWFSQVHELTGESTPFWIIVAGGKSDFTIKWWAQSRWQKVVDHFRRRILFVQVGELHHTHSQLSGVLDLRGKTDLRQLVRLVYHSHGIVCPVTLMMHLSAAVEFRHRPGAFRPCVVVAGGREANHWEAYPGHQFLHTIGALPCCSSGGCWRSRTSPIRDGDEKDHVQYLCQDVINTNRKYRVLSPVQSFNVKKTPQNALAFNATEWPLLLPRCMDLITSEDVINSITQYVKGGQASEFSPAQAKKLAQRLPVLAW